MYFPFKSATWVRSGWSITNLSHWKCAFYLLVIKSFQKNCYCQFVFEKDFVWNDSLSDIIYCLNFFQIFFFLCVLK